MRRLSAWIGGAVGGLAVYRLLRRRLGRGGAEVPSEPAPSEPDERAEELRAKLAESRAEAETEGEPAAEHPPEQPAEPPAPPASLEERRRRVHEEGRAAIDEMEKD